MGVCSMYTYLEVEAELSMAAVIVRNWYFSSSGWRETRKSMCFQCNKFESSKIFSKEISFG